ncbi:MAG: PBP1A family penicillin-binding protein [Mogibacterium sp.]|nr:PBP1A family penicillin-binding protein [Mogibacterium sp.]
MEDKELEKTGEQNKDPAPRPVKLPLRDRDSEPAFNWGDTETVVFTPQTGTPAKERAAKPAKEKREKAPEPPKPPKAKKEKAPESPKPPKAKKEKAPEPPKPPKAKKKKAPEPPKPPKAKKEKAPKPPKPPKAKKEKAPKPPKPPKAKKEKAPKPPKAGRERKRREVTGKRRIAVITAQILLGLFLCAVAVSGAYVAYVAVSSNDIDPHNIYAAVDTSTVLYDKNGEAIDKVYYSEDRELVTINEIPEYTKDAFIAIEDKTFYEHHGFNLHRMIGAVINKLLGRTDAISGTSTITQQLARNVFLPDVKSQRTLRRKVSEMLYARQIERTLTKDEILEAYLNTIYLGYGNYGIGAAARSYFDKDVRDLTLAESAALAALPQAPDSYALLKDDKEEGTVYLKKYDVYANDASKERRDLVLDLMTEQGYISRDEAASARVDIKDILRPHIEEKTSEYTYFTDYVVGEVAKDLEKEYKLTEEDAQRIVYTGGLQIKTTVDPEIQKIINDEFADDYNFPWSAEDPEAAMVVTETENGRIAAMVGGRKKSGRRLFNRAVSPRQPGSSIKPLSVYAAALQKSYDYAEKGEPFPFVNYGFDRQGTYYWGDYITASSYVADEQMIVNGEVWPQNFSRRFTGRQTFRSALQQSLNTCAVKIQLQVGADYSMDILKKFGITTAVDDPEKPVNDLNSAALGLGAMTYGVTPLDMAEAYAAFPNGGKRHDPVCYTEITDSEGRLILLKKSEPVKVMDEGVAFIMTDCLKSVVSRGIARNAGISGVQVGGKTGTTNDTADIWFCGFTPKYSSALWIGTDHNSEMNTTSTTAASLWSRIMSRVPDVTEGEYPEMPADVVLTGGEYYTMGTEPGNYLRR